MSGPRPSTPIQLVAIDEIAVGERLRPLRPVSLPGLAASIQDNGLMQAIVVARTDAGFRLVAGRHRLEACRLLGWTEVPVNVIDVDELGAQLREIDENLLRAELSVLERGEHLVRRSEVLEALGQRARSGRPKKGVAVTPFLATTADLAEAAGVSERTAQRYMQIVRALPPAVRDVIRGSSLANRPGELEELAEMEDPDEQLTVATAIGTGRLWLYYGIDDARRRVKLVYPIECKRDDDPDDEDLEPLGDDEAIEPTRIGPAGKASAETELSPEELRSLKRHGINPASLLPGQRVALPRPPRRPVDLVGQLYALVGTFHILAANELADEIRARPLPLDPEEIEKLCRHLEDSSQAATSLAAAMRAAGALAAVPAGAMSH